MVLSFRTSYGFEFEFYVILFGVSLRVVVLSLCMLQF